MAVLPKLMRSPSRLASRATTGGLNVGTVVAIVVGSIVVLLLLSLCICLFRCGKAISRTKKRVSNRWRKPRGVVGAPYVGKNDEWPQLSKIYDDSLCSDSGVQSANGSNASLPISTHYTHVRYPDLSHQPIAVIRTNSNHTLTPIPLKSKSRGSPSPSDRSVYPPPTHVVTQATSSKVVLQYEPPAFDPKRFPVDVKRILGLDDASFLKELPYYESASSILIAAPTCISPEYGHSTTCSVDLQPHSAFESDLGVGIVPDPAATSGSSNALSTYHGYAFGPCPHDRKTGECANFHSPSVIDSIVLTRDYTYQDTIERVPTNREVCDEKFTNWDGGNAPRTFADTWDVDYDLNPEYFAHVPKSRDTPSDPSAPLSNFSITEQQEVPPPLLDSEIDWYNSIVYVPGLENEMIDMGVAESEAIKMDREDTTPLPVDPEHSRNDYNTYLSIEAKSISYADALASGTNEEQQQKMTALQVNWHKNTMMPPPWTSQPRLDSVITFTDSISITSDFTFDNGPTNKYDTTPGYISPATTGSHTSLIAEYKHSFGHSDDIFQTTTSIPFEPYSDSPVTEIIAPCTLSRFTTIDTSVSASEQDDTDELSHARMSLSTSLTSSAPPTSNEADILALPFRCNHPHCERSYRTQGLLRSHVNRTHKRRHSCSRCDVKKFGLKADLKRHVRSVHAASVNKWQCPNVGCKGDFGRKDNLQRHLKTCSKKQLTV